MACPVKESVTRTTGSASACVVTVPAHVAGDLLVCCISKQGGGTYSSNTGGWTVEPGSGPNVDHNSQILTKVATASGHTLTVTYSASSGFYAYCFVVKGQHATPIIGSARVAHGVATYGTTGALNLGGYDNSLVIYFGACNPNNVTAQHFNTEVVTPLSSDYRYDYGAAHVAVRQMGTYAANNGAPEILHAWNSSDEMTSWTLAIRDAGTGILMPHVDLGIYEICYTQFRSVYGALGSAAPDGFAGVGVAINGIAVNTANTAMSALSDSSWANAAPYMVNSTNYGVETLVGTYSTLDFPNGVSAGDILSLEWRPEQSNTAQFGAGNGGYLFGLKDGSGNWLLWKLGHPLTAVSTVWQRVFIELGSDVSLWAWSDASAAATLAAMDWTGLVGLAVMIDRAPGTTSLTSLYIKNVLIHHSAATISGGCAARPASFNELQIAASAYSYREFISLQGTRQVLSRAKLQLGNGGAIPMYFDGSATAIEFPESYQSTALSDRQKFRVSADLVGLDLYPTAADTLIWAAGVANANQSALLTLNASSSASADCNFAGESAIGFKVSLTPDVLFAGMTFKGGSINLAEAGTYEFIVAESVVVNFTPAAASTYVMGDCTITGTLDLRNTTAYAITVELPSGTATDDSNNTGGAITVTTPTSNITFAGLIAGGTLKAFTTATQTELFSDTNTATSEVWTGASGTFDYTWIKEGYLPIRATGEVVSGSRTITLQPAVDRAYMASSGLTFGTNLFYAPGTKLAGLTVASTLQNLYSALIAAFRVEATLKNKPFPLAANGPNSFSWLNGNTFDLTTYPNSITLLSRDGMQYLDTGGAATDIWAAVLSVGVPSGFQVRYQQQDGIGTTNAQNTGNIDQLIKIKKTGAGAFDYTGWLVLKCQEEGYDQAEAIAADIYGTLEDQLYVFGLTPIPNGIAAGATDATVTVTAEPTPVEWPAASGRFFSTTIKDTDDSHSGLEIMQAVRAENEFNWSDLIRPNGSKFKTVTGNFYGDAYATPAGVRVVKADGVTPHPDFDLFNDDSGSDPYVPPVVAPIGWDGALDGTTVLLYNDVGGGAGVIIDTQTIAGAGGYSLDVTLPSVDVAVGDPLRIRFGHKEYYAGELQGTMTASGLSFVGSMTLHPVYAAWGIDGAVYDQGYTPPGPYTMDGVNLQVDIAAGATTGLKTQLGAWTQYLMTLPAGLDAFYGAWDLLAVNQIRQNVGVVDVKIDVPTAGALYTFTDHDVNYYRSDFSYPGNVEAGHGLIAITYNASIFVPDPVIISGESVVTGTPATVADAVRSNLATELAATLRAEKFARNKQVLNPATGERTVYDDDGTTVLGQGDAFMDVAGTQPYDGTGPVHRTERLA